MADRKEESPAAASAAQHRGSAIKTLLWGVLLAAFLLFVFGPVLGLRETREQMRSRKIHEAHERRIKETLDYSKQERLRSEEDLKRYRKELFGDK